MQRCVAILLLLLAVTTVSSVQGALRIDAGSEHFCALDSAGPRAGVVRCWGRNQWGQLGRDVSAEAPDSARPLSSERVPARTAVTSNTPDVTSAHRRSWPLFATPASLARAFVHRMMWTSSALRQRRPAITCAWSTCQRQPSRLRAGATRAAHCCKVGRPHEFPGHVCAESTVRVSCKAMSVSLHYVYCSCLCRWTGHVLGLQPHGPAGPGQPGALHRRRQHNQSQKCT